MSIDFVAYCLNREHMCKSCVESYARRTLLDTNGRLEASVLEDDCVRLQRSLQTGCNCPPSGIESEILREVYSSILGSNVHSVSEYRPIISLGTYHCEGIGYVTPFVVSPYVATCTVDVSSVSRHVVDNVLGTVTILEPSSTGKDKTNQGYISGVRKLYGRCALQVYGAIPRKWKYKPKPKLDYVNVTSMAIRYHFVIQGKVYICNMSLRGWKIMVIGSTFSGRHVVQDHRVKLYDWDYDRGNCTNAGVDFQGVVTVCGTRHRIMPLVGDIMCMIKDKLSKQSGVKLLWTHFEVLSIIDVPQAMFPQRSTP